MKKLIGAGALGLLAYLMYGWYTGTRARPQVDGANGAADQVQRGANAAADQVAGLSPTAWRIIVIAVIVAAIAAALRVPKIRWAAIGAAVLAAIFLFFTYII